MINREKLELEIMQAGPELNRLLFLDTPDIWLDIELTMAQFKSLVFIITDENANPSRLAKALGVTPANMTGIITRLVKQGLVFRKENPRDRRVLILRATPKGVSLVANLWERRARDMSSILDRMSSEDIYYLAQGFNALLKASRKQRGE
jgi:DNA-binding MarR family transcriptional regulator